MRKIFVLLISAAAFLAGPAGPAFAKKSEWFTGSERRAAYKEVGQNLLTAIECRDSGRKALDLDEVQFRVSYGPNPEKVRFLWAVGTHYGPTRKKAEKRGYKLVSYNSFVRAKSGLRFHCAVWHKK